MKKFRRFLRYSTFVTILCLILVLIPATFLPYRQALIQVYYALWFKWTFCALFLTLSACWIVISLVQREVRSLAVHLGIILILVGAIFSSGAVRGRVAVKEGEMFDSFNDLGKERHTFPSPVTLVKFEEENYVNRISISNKEYEFAPSHPLKKWGYYFFSYDYDIKWDVKKVVLNDKQKRQYKFDYLNNTKFISPYSLHFIGLRINRDKDTLAEFMVFEKETIEGALFVGRNGILAPSYGLNLTLCESEFSTSYISTIQIAKDPGLGWVIWGFVVCCLGYLIAIIRRRWLK